MIPLKRWRRNFDETMEKKWAGCWSETGVEGDDEYVGGNEKMTWG